MPAAKRNPINFSQIITPHTACRTSDFINVRSQKHLLIAHSDLSIPKPERVIKQAGDPKKRDLLKSTSQNHIISYLYLQQTIELAVKIIKAHEKSGNNDATCRLNRQMEIFIKDVFSKKENLLISESLKYLNSREALKLSHLIASKASNNAVEGNASANSGIGEKMDAPTDSHGKLLPAFDKMRDVYLVLSSEIHICIDCPYEKKKFHILVLKAISPDALGSNVVRASSKQYKYEQKTISKRSLSSPPEHGHGVNRLMLSSYKTDDARTKKKLTVSQKRHQESGLLYYRSPSLSFA